MAYQQRAKESEIEDEKKAERSSLRVKRRGETDDDEE